MTAVLKSTPVVLPGSAVDDGAIAQEQVSRLFTGLSVRVAAELSRGRPARLYVGDHALDPMLDDALAEAGIDLADDCLEFTRPSATMEITRDAVSVHHHYTTDPQILWQGPASAGL